MSDHFTHFDHKGNAVMVDVSQKPITARTAAAQGKILVSPAVMDAVCRGTAEKGDVLGVARVAGIMAAKRTFELIPMCHPLPLTKCTVDFSLDGQNNTMTAVCTVSVNGPTGVEMEALTGLSVALLTVYDMCKGIDKNMEITGISLREKSGGKSGRYRNERLFDGGDPP